MNNVLVLKNSILGEASASNGLIDEAVAALSRIHNAAFTVRDLANSPVPHFDAHAAVGLRSEPQNDRQRAARALSDALVGELAAADTILIGAPMYNFGLPTTLKAWFDYVLRAGVTFRYTETGAAEGLVQGKRAIVVLSRGGIYSGGPAALMDSQEPHIRTLLAFIGITDVDFIRAEGLALGPDHRERGLAQARSRLLEALRIIEAEKLRAAG